MMNAIKDLVPNVEQRNCAKHIRANWKKRGFEGKSSSLYFGMWLNVQMRTN